MGYQFSTFSLDENPSRAVLKIEDIQRKSQFSQSDCLVTISVGQEVHEGDKFVSTLGLVNQSFKSATLCVDDTLQRYTMALMQRKNPSDLYEASLQAGDEWLMRNSKIIEQITIPYNIIRWDHWLEHPDYQRALQNIEERLKKDITYSELVTSSVNDFASRYAKRVPKEEFDYNRVARACLNYLKEECAAMLLWQEHGWHFEVYPGKRNAAMQATHHRFILPNNQELLHAVWVKFKGRKQLKPQAFDVESVDTRETTLEMG